MKITRLYTGADGESHFEDIDLRFEPMKTAEASPRANLTSGKMSPLRDATGIIFRETGPNYDYDWHTVPHRQYVITFHNAYAIAAYQLTNLTGWFAYPLG